MIVFFGVTYFGTNWRSGCDGLKPEHTSVAAEGPARRRPEQLGPVALGRLSAPVGEAALPRNSPPRRRHTVVPFSLVGASVQPASLELELGVELAPWAGSSSPRVCLCRASVALNYLE